MKKTFLFLLVLIPYLCLLAQSQAEFDKLKDLWIADYNKKEFLKTEPCQYTKSSVGYYNFNPSYGIDSINYGLEKLNQDIGDISGHMSFSLFRHDSEHFFEIGHLERGGKQPLIFLIAWSKQSAGWIRELDFIVENTATTCSEFMGVEEARNRWIRISNSKNPQLLTDSCYTDKSLYLNQGSYALGRDEIAAHYGYMSGPDWQISLDAYDVLVVQKGYILEVGEYISSSKGLYIMLWQKQENNIWRAMLDFNF